MVTRILFSLFLALGAMAGPALAQTAGRSGDGEVMIPGIWVDPDGCEHWVMDDGWEGFMSPVIMPDGRPVCGRKAPAAHSCGVLDSDQFFATGGATLGPGAVASLKKFFASHRRDAFVIEGHTDSRGGAAYNLALSRDRAAAVAAVAQAVGARVKQAVGYGESRPRATNGTAAGRSLNRRVEIRCVRK